MNTNVRLELDRVFRQIGIHGDSHVRLSEQSDSRYGVHYYSEREGIASIMGLLQSLGKRFDAEIEVAQTYSQE